MGIRRLSDSNLNNNVSYASMKAGSILPSSVTGGTQTISGDFVYRTFTASGTLTISGAPLLCDALIIAGGGAGGNSGGNGSPGGGGAGGLLLLEGITLNPATLTVSIGAGGSGGTGGAQGGNGTNSSITGLTAAVGGGGGGGFTLAGGSGGSGGGGYSSGTASGQAGGSGTAGQGFAGNAGNNNVAGGGGGAAEAGGAKSGSLWSSLTPIYNITAARNLYGGTGRVLQDWGSATNTGWLFGGSRYFASGAWGHDGTGTQPQFFSPGAGMSNPSAQPGVVNTGSGGGGSSNGAAVGASGGSGIVIVRFRKELVGL